MRDYLLHYCSAGFASRIVLHSHFSLALEMGLKGVHINENAKQIKEVWTQFPCVSVAIHQLAESYTPIYQTVEYAMVSPIFPSISKKGYCPQFTLLQFQNAIIATNYSIVALGGLAPKQIPLIRQRGCYGAAFLGYLWENPKAKDWKKRVNELRNYRDE